MGAGIAGQQPEGADALTLWFNPPAPLHAAGLPGREAALTFRLIYDYTLGFALADPASPAERPGNPAARTQADMHPPGTSGES